MNECTFILLGATGDLAKRKLIPAFYEMLTLNKIQKFVFVGAAFEDVTIDHVLDAAKAFISQPVNEDIWQQLKNNAYYQRLNFTDPQDFNALQALVVALEKKHEVQGNRLIYLAAAANFYCDITHNLVAAGVAKKLDATEPIWHRIVYEKPFGHDTQSAHEINACIEKNLYEQQIYRIDHYLTKELVSNITLIRFTNCVFEPLWNNRFIDNVQIILSEEVGLEGRGAYYDAYGALCDVVQNHMLELMALITMEAPEKITGEFIRNARAKALQKVRVVDAVLGQYEGYTQERAVAKNSQTETFAALFLMVDNPRWAGVPFYLKTGKCLEKKETVIHIKFKQVDCLFTQQCPSESNYLTIRLYPDESFILTLNAKKPGSQDLVPIAMEYCHSCQFGLFTPSAHAVLLEEVMRGEQSVSVRFDEIEYAWRIIDTIKSKKWPLQLYSQGSKGPEAAEEFAKNHGMRWRS